MNIQQLRALCEVVRNGLHISAAAKALHSSQSAVSKQIHDLENELGITVLVRRRNRIMAVSEPGKQLVAVAERIVNDAKTMRQIASEYADTDQGQLILATTHTHARYTLPRHVKAFAARYERVFLGLRAGTPGECCKLLAEGHADLAIITTQPDDVSGDLVAIPAYRLERCLVALRGHPLLRTANLRLEDIARYPLITYDLTSSWRRVTRAFEKHHLNPTVVLSAIDPEICKAYVGLGMGVAILPRIAYDPDADTKLGVASVKGLFQEGTVSVYLRKNAYLRQFVYDFISMFAPHLDARTVNRCVYDGLAGSASPALRDIPLARA